MIRKALKTAARLAALPLTIPAWALGNALTVPLLKHQLRREADRGKRMQAERGVTERMADRLRHGQDIEGDHVCPDALRADEAERKLNMANGTVYEQIRALQCKDHEIDGLQMDLDEAQWQRDRARRWASLWHERARTYRRATNLCQDAEQAAYDNCDATVTEARADLARARAERDEVQQWATLLEADLGRRMNDFRDQAIHFKLAADEAERRYAALRSAVDGLITEWCVTAESYSQGELYGCVNRLRDILDAADKPLPAAPPTDEPRYARGDDPSFPCCRNLTLVGKCIRSDGHHEFCPKPPANPDHVGSLTEKVRRLEDGITEALSVARPGYPSAGGLEAREMWFAREAYQDKVFIALKQADGTLAIPDRQSAEEAMAAAWAEIPGGAVPGKSLPEAIREMRARHHEVVAERDATIRQLRESGGGTP
jgi:hypothetical protein